MISIYSHCFLERDYVPVVYAYYDRADMLSTTMDEVVHSHTLCEIMYVTEGTASVDVSGSLVTLSRHQFIFIDSDIRHRLVLDRSVPFGMMNIEFQFETDDKRCPSIKSLSLCSPALLHMLTTPAPYMVLTDENGTVHDLMKQIILSAAGTRMESERICSLMAAQVILLMARLWQKTRLPQRSAYVEGALDIIAKRYSGELTVLSIAQELHIHPTYLHKLFRKETGYSVCEYIQHVRLEHASKLLTENHTLREISTAVGISSPQYFAKLFKRAYGMTPGEYKLRSK